ncbi:DUF6036 family nucleotidyltransferase [Ferrimicrobium acidiphilum]|uniref:DUF6036 domain-containing protein n=1 Tax=Ferrimicrobium acidiphilum DSM 19497 TaxID=1121877 RepID=A0A0D8FVI9_9ACTN|nr:DUF6036 family nucleotidyltransferase [Ferrimicrobium acidiphilum]KJE77285.1 hypothetical protein FEAC_09990 [Ferrimicrobium acidiphilum DSM 19497]MCL5054239.1 DUF6036 family nucleotidyltransferase [Gammaproteobacteria bacterium]
MPNEPLTRTDLIVVLHELADALDAAGIEAQLYIVGGAAMVLGYSARDVTRDVDAQYYPKNAINNVAAAIARRHHLPNDWLNDNAAMFISPVKDDEKRRLFLSKGSVTIQTASAEALLAMKIRASRPRMDNFDIAFLCEHLEITSIVQAVDLYETYYPEDRLPKYALTILRAILKLDK